MQINRLSNQNQLNNSRLLNGSNLLDGSLLDMTGRAVGMKVLGSGERDISAQIPMTETNVAIKVGKPS